MSRFRFLHGPYLLFAAIGLSHMQGAPESVRAAQVPSADRVACEAQSVGLRTSASMTYDTRLRQVVMLGGTAEQSAALLPTSLWTWNGETWKCLSADGPPGRRDAFLEFDDARRELVFFGGRRFVNRDIEYFTDTWVWNGAAWNLRDTKGPGPRIHGASAYDPQRRAVIVHGGASPEGHLRDTWRWSGADWQEIRWTLPFNGNGNSVVAADGRLMLLAAERGVSECGELQRARVFRISLENELTDAQSPGPCFSQQVPATAFAGGIVLFAGWNGPHSPAESWTWSNGRWQRTESAPTRRRGAAAAYDPIRKRVVLFGGTDDNGILGDTWEFDGTRWSRIRSVLGFSGSRVLEFAVR